MDNRISNLLEHPLHRYIGITEVEADSGQGEFSVLVHERIVNHADILHAGVIYLLCDICALCGLLSVLDANKTAATHNLNVSLMRPTKLGAMVRFKSDVTKLGSRLAFIDVEVFTEDGLVASAHVIKSIINPTHQ